mgnify:CR=1 FL=1
MVQQIFITTRTFLRSQKKIEKIYYILRSLPEFERRVEMTLKRVMLELMIFGFFLAARYNRSTYSKLFS